MSTNCRSGLPRGWNLSAIDRTSGKRYTARPPANCVAARAAWDYFAEEGEIEWIQLLDGYWGCQRPLVDTTEEVEAVHFRRTR